MVDYGFYMNVFGGDKIPIEAFDRTKNKAEVYLNRFTFGRATAGGENVKPCLCEMCDVIYAFCEIENGKEKRSESTDGYSVSYVTECADGQDRNEVLEKKLYRIADIYLSNTGMLYLGL